MASRRASRPARAGRATRVPPGLLRLSVGLEDPDALWRDLERALARALTMRFLIDRIRNGGAPKTPEEADRLALRQLAGRGADLAKPRHVIHFLYFADGDGRARRRRGDRGARGPRTSRRPTRRPTSGASRPTGTARCGPDTSRRSARGSRAVAAEHRRRVRRLGGLPPSRSAYARSRSSGRELFRPAGRRPCRPSVTVRCASEVALEVPPDAVDVGDRCSAELSNSRTKVGPLQPVVAAGDTPSDDVCPAQPEAPCGQESRLARPARTRSRATRPGRGWLWRKVRRE